MAHSTRLADWLLGHAERLNLRVTEYSWPREWNLDDLFDIQVTVDLAGKTFLGRGTAHDETLAFTKAGAEALERAYCAYYGIHSTGVAAHDTESLAAANAQSELFEREAFFCHFHSKTPFIPMTENNLAARYPGAFEQLKKIGISLQFLTALVKDREVVVCVASGLNAKPAWGGTVGLASSARLENATERAFFECLRNIAAVIHLGVKPTLSLDQFLSIKAPSTLDRQALALNVDFWRGVQHLFPPQTSSAYQKIVGIGWKDFAIETLANPFKEINNVPLIICRALAVRDSEFVKKSDKSPVTTNRLQEFAGNQEFELETNPSFLG